MRSGGVAGVAGVGDDVAGLHGPGPELVAAEVAVPGLGAVRRRHLGHVAVGHVVLRGDRAVGGRHDGRAVGDGEVDAGVHRHPVDAGLAVVRAEAVLAHRQRELRPLALLAGGFLRLALALLVLAGLEVDPLLGAAGAGGEVVGAPADAGELGVQLAVGGRELDRGVGGGGGGGLLGVLLAAGHDGGGGDAGHAHHGDGRHGDGQQRLAPRAVAGAGGSALAPAGPGLVRDGGGGGEVVRRVRRIGGVREGAREIVRIDGRHGAGLGVGDGTRAGRGGHVDAGEVDHERRRVLRRAVVGRGAGAGVGAGVPGLRLLGAEVPLAGGGRGVRRVPRRGRVRVRVLPGGVPRLGGDAARVPLTGVVAGVVRGGVRGVVRTRRRTRRVPGARVPLARISGITPMAGRIPLTRVMRGGVMPTGEVLTGGVLGAEVVTVEIPGLRVTGDAPLTGGVPMAGCVGGAGRPLTCGVAVVSGIGLGRALLLVRGVVLPVPKRGVGSGNGLSRARRRVTVVHHHIHFALAVRRISGDCTRRYAAATIFPTFRCGEGWAFSRLLAD